MRQDTAGGASISRNGSLPLCGGPSASLPPCEGGLGWEVTRPWPIGRATRVFGSLTFAWWVTTGLLFAQEAIPTPTAALERLKEGNARFAGDRPAAKDQGSKRRAELARGQRPFAVIITCSDSRVPPETVFDQGLGDLFVIRLAGNVVDTAAVGSVEYAVAHLHVPLVVVLGHEECGAVQAGARWQAAPWRFGPTYRNGPRWQSAAPRRQGAPSGRYPRQRRPPGARIDPALSRNQRFRRHGVRPRCDWFLRPDQR